MVKAPLVSICIPTFNGEKYIAEAIKSAIQQTYLNLEIIVSDDDSKDGTLAVIEGYKAKTNIPIYINNHKPHGIGANWNNCVKKANGKYIKFLFQDDILYPSCVEKMVLQASQNKNIGLVYSKRDFIYNSEEKKNADWVKDYSNLHTHWKTIKILDKKACKGTELLKNYNLLSFPKNKIGEPTAVLLLKDVFNRVGYFSNELKQGLDVEYWYRVMKFYDVLFIDETLISFRLHNNQASNINAENHLNEERLLNKNLYTNLFWQLNWRYKKQFFLSFNILGRSYNKLKKYFRIKTLER